MIYSVLKVIVGIMVTVGCSRIGIRRLLYMTVAFIAGYASVSLVKAFCESIASFLEGFLSATNAYVISFIILAIPPLLIIPFLGRKMIIVLKITDDISPVLDSILGAGFGLTIYLSVLYII